MGHEAVGVGCGTTRVAIVGGGIGGLTVARALCQRGAAVSVFERREELPTVGAGIILGPNALAVLEALGLGEALRGAGHPLSGLVLTDARGRTLQRVEHTGLGASFRRGELLSILAQGLSVRFGSALDEVEQVGDRVRIAGVEGSWDWLIGADGIRSATRSSLGRAARSRYSGQTCWRFVAPTGLDERRWAEERWGTDRRVGLVPLREGTYCYLVRSAPRGTTATPTSRSELCAEFGGLHPLVPHLLAELGDGPLLHNDLEDHEAIDFGSGRIILLGDAAHAVTPNLGQGAGMAIEDAWVLAWSMAETDPLAAYSRRRRERVERVWRTSARLGTIAHARGSLIRWCRDLAMRWTPASVVRAQSRWLAQGVVREALPSASP